MKTENTKIISQTNPIIRGKNKIKKTIVKKRPGPK